MFNWLFSITLLKKTCYCELHIKKHGSLYGQAIDIDGVIKSFMIKLDKMEQYLIYIQERLNYFEVLNSDENLNNEGELNNIKESLDRKIRRNIKYIVQ